MRASTTFLLLTLVLTACGERRDGQQAEQTADRDTAHAPSVAPARGDTAWRVGFDAVGPVRFGTPRAVAFAAIGIEEREPPVPRAPTCQYVAEPDPLRAHSVGLMLANGTVVRVDVDSGSVATIWGDRIGDAETAVLDRHRGHVRVEPHKYTGPQGHYLIVGSPDDSTHGLVFETDGGRVTRYRAGLRPYVEWVERCG